MSIDFIPERDSYFAKFTFCPRTSASKYSIMNWYPRAQVEELGIEEIARRFREYCNEILAKEMAEGKVYD